MIMLDLQKAFDTVDHSILFGKLELMGVKSAPWFKSYLSGRKQVVNIGKTFSNASAVTCGVPQGSILGPLLFLCYVNDMVTSIDKDCKLILDADDSTILFSHKDPEFISSKLGKVLGGCSEWLVDSKLSLHLGKTEYMLFGPKRKLNKGSQLSVSCNGHDIKYFERREDRMQYNTRASSFNLNVPNVNNVSKQTFYYHGIVDWNSLPEEIKAVKNAHKYKASVIISA